ncbi:hypothetical protein E8L90_17970 [Brevibacillus antibioticus]|uniref:Uncharacterized protein n=1 Tax=Brevibacillus antibioticus TaxID=2570228 RepID=A0A4U2YB37_9BACL|nr:hypothetical protein [Brevibacillus antibioticus]TKI57192.1 hypothetical protein E8L90_17970 [Brevibacillus antibioticus]
MRNHMFYRPLQESNLSVEAETLNELKFLIREEFEIDKAIREKFPIELFGKPSDTLLIEGSKDVMECFKSIDAKKVDIKDKIKNIDHLGFDDGEIVLNFKDDDITATAVYDFTYDFFEDLFDMGKYSKFCRENMLLDLTKLNVEWLFEKFNEKEMQYRLLNLGEEYFLRGITSTVYKNYDNNLAIYIGFLALHKFAAEMDVSFYIEKAYLSDSAISILFRQLKPITIKGVGEVYFGAVLKNNEIRDSTFSLEFRYTVVNGNDSFSGIPTLRDAIFNIKHTSSIHTMETNVEKIYKMRELQDVMLSYIKQFSKLEKISKAELYPLYTKVINAKSKLQSGTRTKVKEYYERDFVENTQSLIQIFSKITDFSVEIEEKLFLEHLYHEAITELIKKEKEKVGN